MALTREWAEGKSLHLYRNLGFSLSFPQDRGYKSRAEMERGMPGLALICPPSEGLSGRRLF